MIMTHGDDKGLVLPPRVAPKQVVIIPIPNSKTPPEAVTAMFDQVRAARSSAPCAADGGMASLRRRVRSSS